MRFKAFFALFAVIALVGGCATRPSKVTPAEAQIAALARAAVDRSFAPGVVVLVKERDRAPYAYAYGQRTIETRAPLRNDDLFRIYSMTKPVTVAAAMILVDDGVIKLDDPVSSYIPSFANARVYAGGDTIATMQTAPLIRPLTIRDLMRHTAGMTYKSADPHPPHWLYVLRGVDTGSGADIPPQDGSPPVSSSADLADRIAAIPLLHQPGARFSYGNAIDVLGRVIEIAAGEQLGDFMERRLFAPLGMKDTSFRVDAEDAPRMTAAYSAKASAPVTGGVLDAAKLADLDRGTLTLADPPENGVFARERAMHYGGAGLMSTAPDYLRFAEMLLNGGALGGVRVLSEGAVAEMTREQLSADVLAASPALTQEGLTFGLGVAIKKHRAVARTKAPVGSYFWGGAASTNFWVDPENRIVGVVMTQVFGGDFRTYYLEMLRAIYPDDADPGQ